MSSLPASLELQLLDYDLAICLLHAQTVYEHQIPETRFLCFFKTPEETSIVVEHDHVPNDALKVERGWKAIKVKGPLEFDMVGVIARLSSILAEANIPIFVVSSFNTDYILFKKAYLGLLIDVFLENDCRIDAF